MNTYRKTTTTTYRLLSPDGIAIDKDLYMNRTQMEEAFLSWIERFVHQGYYSSVKYGRISLPRLRTYCIEKEHEMTLYEVMEYYNIQMDHHESDLYVIKDDHSSELLKLFPVQEKTATVFTGDDGKQWYDIAFAYDPWWEEKVKEITS